MRKEASPGRGIPAGVWLLETDNGIGPPTYEAELHVWDGMWHALCNDPDLPDCREVFRLAVTFFDALLGMARIDI